MKEKEILNSKQIQQKKESQVKPTEISSVEVPLKENLETVSKDLESGEPRLGSINDESPKLEKFETTIPKHGSFDAGDVSEKEHGAGLKEETQLEGNDPKKTNENLSGRTESTVVWDKKKNGQISEKLKVEEKREGFGLRDDSRNKVEPEIKRKNEKLTPLKKVKPKWQDNEPPEELGDRMPHVMQNSEDYEKYGIVAASVRGKSHAHKGSFREDSFKFDQEGQWTIIAVGDGAGSAKLSRVGSVAVCESAVGKLKELLKDYSLKEGEKDAEKPAENELQQLKAFLVLAACEARNELLRKCHEKECQFDDLSTTLLVVLHCEWNSQHVLCSLQVGDGAIGIYEDEKHSCTLFGDADHGAHASETIFMTSRGKLVEKPFDQRIQFSIKPALKCVGVMTDGVSDDFFPEKDRLVELFDGQPINGIVGEDEEPLQGVRHNVLKDSDPEKSLVDWLGYEQKGSFDDRTLVLFYRK